MLGGGQPLKPGPGLDAAADTWKNQLYVIDVAVFRFDIWKVHD